jgi:hypothetical protein
MDPGFRRGDEWGNAGTLLQAEAITLQVSLRSAGTDIASRAGSGVRKGEGPIGALACRSGWGAVAFINAAFISLS